MSFKDCINGHVKDGLIDQTTAEKLVKDYDELMKSNSKNPFQAMILEKKKLQIQRKVSTQLHLAKRSEFLEKLKTAKDGTEAVNIIKDSLDRVNQESDSIHRELKGILDDNAKDFVGTTEDLIEGFKLVLDGVKDSSNKNALQLADSLRKMFKHAKNMSDEVGLVMGDLGERYLPQSWKKEFVAKVSDKEFVEDMFPRLNREEFFEGFSDEQLKEMIVAGKRSIETNGQYDIKIAIEKGEFPNLRTKDMSNVELKKSAQRVFHFKGSKEYLEMAEKYSEGAKGVSDSVLKYMNQISINIAAARRLGPKSGDLIREMGQYIQVSHPKASVKSLNANYNVLMGTAFTGDRTATSYKLFTATQNWMRASHLGGAVISALTDPMFNMVTNRVNGGNYLAPIKEMFKVLSQDPQTKKIAKELNYDISDLSGTLMQEARMALGEQDPKGISGALARATFQLSGLDAWTRMGRVTAALTANSRLTGMLKKTKWDDLGGFTKKNLEISGIGKKEYELLASNMDKLEFLGSKGNYLNHDSIRNIEGLTYRQANDLATAFDGYITRMKNTAMNENNLSSQAITSGAILSESGKASTTGKVTAAMVLQYKTFPINVYFNHTRPAFQMAWEGLKKGEISQLEYVTMLSVGMGLMAIGPMQLKELVKGRTPKPLFDEEGNFKKEILFAGIMQAGGFGLMGDFILKDQSRFGRSFGEEIAGPYIGTLSDTVKLFKGKLLDEALYNDGENLDKFKVSGLRYLRRNTPVVSSLWYTRLMTDRLVFDALERMVDPKFDRRMRANEKRLKKESGQELIFGTGE